MSKGVITSSQELIALKRFAQRKPPKGASKGLKSAHYLSHFRGRGMDFAEVRHYQAGDEIKHMEWRVTARSGRPHIKVYQEERERPVVILVDFSLSMYFGTREAFKSVIAARLAALLAWTSIKQGDRVGGLLFSNSCHSEFVPRKRESSILPFLAALSHYTEQLNPPETGHSTTLAEELRRLRHVTKPGSLIILISDFYQVDRHCEKHLSRLRCHNDLIAYHVCDALELAPPLPGRYVMTDGSQVSLLDTYSRTICNTYNAWSEQRIALLQTQFKRLSIAYHKLLTDTDLPSLVYRTFPRRLHG